MLPKFFSKFLQFVAVSTILILISVIFLQLLNTLNSIDETNNSDTLLSIEKRYFIDNENQKTFPIIKQQIDSFKFAKNGKIPFELGEQAYWVYIAVSNKTAQNKSLVLYADNSLLNTFNLYQQERSLLGSKQYQKSDLIKVNENILLKSYPHFSFTLPANSTEKFIIKLQTNGPPNIPLMILSDDEFQQRILYAQLFYGAFIGMVLLMAMYNLVLYFSIKDKVYLFYIGYLLSAFYVLSSLTGFGYLVFSSESQAFINKYLLFIDYYLVVFLLSFTLYFLRYNRQNNRTFKLGLLITAGIIACSFFSLSLGIINQTKLFFSLQPIVYLFVLFIIFRRLKSDFSWAKFYVLSWVPLLLGAAIQPLVLLNYLEYSFITRNAFLFAVIAEVTLMAFALAERMKRNESDRIKDVVYHTTNGLPRKSNLENKINTLINRNNHSFSVIIIKPEQIEKVALYIDDSINTELFQHIYTKLSSLFQFNDAIYTITENKEKLCLINYNAFAIIINKNNQEQSLEQLIESIQKTISENYHIRNLKLPLSSVLGIANAAEHSNKSHQLINHALLAVAQGELTHQKWAYYQDKPSEEVNELLQLTSELKQALENNQLEIFHQPQVDLRTLRICSSECLLRWQHPSKGFVSPDIFIPIAEDMGLINQLTLWVLKKSLQQQLILSSEYGFNHMVSINISGKDIASAHFFTQVIDIIEASTIPADKIIFELTESASIAYNEQSLALIEKLNDLGITISIDDFGTGYSSMSQISHLPFQELKVDREFVENVNDDKKRKIIAEATVKMAKGIGLEVVAEGINSQKDEDTLRAFGCDIGQGYFYAKPMAFDDYLTWLENLDNGRIKQPLKGEFIPAEK